MLYNESTGKPKVQADVFSLESLIAWLETMPPKTKYCSWDLENCLLAQWARAMGDDDVNRRSWSLGHDPMFETIASIDGPRDQPHTFGAALSRARTALQAQP